MVRKPAKILVIANGSGEDAIACKIIRELRMQADQELDIRAWPMVGEGRAYERLQVKRVGHFNQLPSEGFGTLSLPMFIRDLKAGWISTHWKQFQYARQLKGQFDLLLLVGDIVPLFAGYLSSGRLAFVSCAKSAYYDGADGHTSQERRIMRKHCELVFPRDALTSQRLDKQAISNQYVGNPMMDGLEPSDQRSIPHSDFTIGLLPGSRKDAEVNALNLFRSCVIAHMKASTPEDTLFCFACHEDFDLSDVRDKLQSGDFPQTFDIEPIASNSLEQQEAISVTGKSGFRALFAKFRFAEILHQSNLVIGCAGTANEQAIGLGKPLIFVPGAGNQGEAYLKMKAPFFGESAVISDGSPDDIAEKIAELCNDPQRCAAMAKAGKERMGSPGASAAIAEKLLTLIA